MPSRRAFLATATAAVSAPLVWSRRVTAAPSERLALGFVGVGTMGRGHLGGFLGRDTVEVVAVCDVVAERKGSAAVTVEKRYAARAKSGQYPGVKAYTDYRELIDHKGLDAVVVATPDHQHAPVCILAAKSGKHIYCEKPLSNYLADGRAVADAVAKAGIAFQTGSQQRTEFNGYFRQAVELIWNGRIGRLKTVHIGVGEAAKPCDLPTQETPAGTDWNRWLGPAPRRGYHEELCPKGIHKHFPAWRKYQEYGGGQLADMGAHHFDIAQWAMKMDAGGPVLVVPPADPKRQSGLRFVYASGVEVIHNEFEPDAAGKPMKADCVFEGTDGTILVSRGGISSLPDSILKEPLGDRAERVYPATSHHGNWLDCIKSGKPTICPAEVGHRTASVCHLGNIGYRLGRKLRWNPATERFVNDPAAEKELAREAALVE